MRRVAALALLGLALPGCSVRVFSGKAVLRDLPLAAPSAPEDPSLVRIGVPYAFRLYTHCGVVGARFAGRDWIAEPPLTDGQGNPPRAWQNPFHLGTMTLLGNDRAIYRTDTGFVARFRVRLGTDPPQKVCD